MCEAGIRQEVRSWFAAFDAKKIQREVYKLDGRHLDVQPTANDGLMQ